jgi:hypothetical protein
MARDGGGSLDEVAQTLDCVVARIDSDLAGSANAA